MLLDIGGNPIEKIPSDFGGRLVIAQAGSTSYTYHEDLSEHYLFVRNGEEKVSGTLKVGKAKVIDGNNQQFVKITSDSPEDKSVNSKSVPINFDKDSLKDNNEINFTGVDRSGTTWISVGSDQDGNKYVYEIEEEPVEGYETKIDGYTITNTYIDNPPPISPYNETPKNPDTPPVVSYDNPPQEYNSSEDSDKKISTGSQEVGDYSINNRPNPQTGNQKNHNEISVEATWGIIVAIMISFMVIGRKPTKKPNK